MAQWLRLDLTSFESVTFFIRMIYKDVTKPTAY